MYVIPSTDKETLIVVTQGKPVTNAVKKSLINQGAKHYFVINSEEEEPGEKIQLPN